MGQRWSLSNETMRANFDSYVSQMVLAGKKPVVEFISEKRSLDQNGMIQALYRQIAAQVDDESVIDVTRRCKLNYGVPLLRANDEQFRAMYDKAIRKNLTYEEKIDAMDILPVTSRMDTPTATEYIDTVIREHSSRGLCLTHPSESER